MVQETRSGRTMPFHNIMDWVRRPSFGGALVTAMAGIVVWVLPMGAGLERLSFDLLTVRSASRDFPELVLIEMDEPSHDELKQDRGKPWDRRLHARLVEFLRNEGAPVIVFDAEFYEGSDDPATTAEFAAALRAHGQIVLAAQLARIGKPGYGGTTIRRPLPELLVPGVKWGVSWNLPGPAGEEDGMVRRHPQGRDPDPSLPWMAAAATKAKVTREGARHDAERWVRHYGPFGTFRRVSYWQATNEAPEFYRGKTVFIGGRPGSGFAGEEGDQFRTPWSRWNGSMVSGLELTATAWLNLVRGDWLNRAPPSTEAAALFFFGALLGGALGASTGWRGFWIAGLSLACVWFTAFWLFQRHNVWCDWAVAAFVELPVAVAWCGAARYRRLRREKDWLEAPLAEFLPDSPLASMRDAAHRLSGQKEQSVESGAAAGAPPISDYALLRCIGRGAYGEVWLARDVLGGFRAVKVVRRIAFDDDGPYEREFRGLQKFAPISREHPGVVQVLHVGLNHPGGFFYYVMEIGDDERTGQSIDPEQYAPRNLERDLRLRGRWNAGRAVELGLALCDALGFVHERHLIHRDIKPANVIFVGGRPKLADVGLVTDLSDRARGVTQVGTEGFVPPEGSGTAAGDVFALGRLLEEVVERVEDRDEATTALLDIFGLAHAGDPSSRYPSARALATALEQWRNKYLPALGQSA
jgi:CHASE2 domain-containing sensor protein